MCKKVLHYRQKYHLKLFTQVEVLRFSKRSVLKTAELDAVDTMNLNVQSILPKKFFLPFLRFNYDKFRMHWISSSNESMNSFHAPLQVQQLPRDSRCKANNFIISSFTQFYPNTELNLTKKKQQKILLHLSEDGHTYLLLTQQQVRLNLIILIQSLKLINKGLLLETNYLQCDISSFTVKLTNQCVTKNNQQEEPES